MIFLRKKVHPILNVKTITLENQKLYQYAFIFEHFDDFVAIVDSSTRIVEYANTVAIEMFQLDSKEQLIGRTIPNFRKIALTDRKINAIMNHVKQGRQYREEVEFVSSKGREFWGLMRANQLRIDHVDYVIYKITDISKLKRIQGENEAYNQRLKFALEGNGDGLWDWHIPSSSVYFSKSWKYMLGYQDHEIINNFENFKKLLHPDDAETVLSKVAYYLANYTGQSYDIEFRMLCKDKSYKWINARGMIVEFAADGSPIRFVGTHSDIDKLKKVQEDLELYSMRLEKSNSDIRQFAYITTHDLKEPLRTISNNIQLLRLKNKELLNAESLQLISYSIEGCKKLTGIIKELLDYAQLEIGEEDRECLNLNHIIDTVLGNLEQYINSNNAIVICEKLPVSFFGNRLQISRLFQNLITNAIKYNDKAQPVIEIKVKYKDNKHIIAVKDNGIGISKDFDQKIYQIFKRLRTESNSESVGMGLAVCKKIVEAHKGFLWHDSTVNYGTTFYFSLPSDPAQ